jgi:hypothetical protein
MSDGDDLSRRAGEIYSFATQMSFEDAMQRRLRYHLLRLTANGLHRDEVEDLGELGRLAFEESDVTGQTTKIKERAGASSLAFAIADIVERAHRGGGGPVSRREVFIGAVLGAYAAVSSAGGMDQTLVAILGAIGGAVATPTSTFIADQIIPRESLPEYLRLKED